MRHLFFTVLFAAWSALVLVEGGQASQKSGPSDLDSPLLKEPMYLSTPKYSLIALGGIAGAKVWMVEDGRRLFVDKNGNGDLTDDGPPIQPSNLRTVGANGWDFNYLLDAITPPNGSRHTSFDLRRWNYGEKEDSYGLSLSVDGKLPMYAGWFGTFWSAKRETAPVVHFGGPFVPTLLRDKEFTLGSGKRRLSLALMNPGSGPGAESRLSIEALPRHVVPKLSIAWPTAAGAPALLTSHELTERCCYWEYYTTDFRVPRGAVVGKAKLTVQLPTAGTMISLVTTEFEAAVVEGGKPDIAR